MNAGQLLAQAVGVAYAAGLNLYATIGIIGVAARLGWIGGLPGSLANLDAWWVIVVALVLACVELIVSLRPATASIWDTIHSLIRPPAAAALAASTAWHGDPAFVLIAALLGGTMAVVTHTTKLGLRYAIEMSPEPVSAAVTGLAELGLITVIVLSVWQHPYLTVALAVALLAVLIFTVRLIWRALQQVFKGRWVPHHGFLQDARTSDRLGRREDDR